ncbi:hypothetical protein GY21_10815 [Cryobacterium roopkundense]|uniref:Winged helix DNA-binding domain-containing protein n=1 Tax=Cryobacterium roopkundense TaxID=1001240 RepID=A0A099J5A5_9MICO|nr:hypothetical protein GY21_10815 [Cryobacterium roopkundense]
MSVADLRRWRLNSQSLASGTADVVAGGVAGAVAATQRLLAVQAQDYPASKWALGARSPGTTAAHVEEALNTGLIVRSWPMRGTLHLVPAHDLHWMLRLSTRRLVIGAKTRQAQLGLTEQILEAARALAVDALTGGRELSRADFLALLESRGIDTGEQRGYHLIWFLAQTGTLCWGRQVGTQQVLVLLDEWVPDARTLEGDEALGEFALRYFTGHGPATLADFAGWSQLTLTDARIGLAVARQDLVEFSVDGVSHFLLARYDTGTRPRQRSAIMLLPGFDEYFLGYRDRSAVIGPADEQRVTPGKNGIFRPLVVFEGRIIGTWRKRASAGAIRVTAELFRSFTGRQQAGLRRCVLDYGRFLGVEPILVPAPAAPS